MTVDATTIENRIQSVMDTTQAQATILTNAASGMISEAVSNMNHFTLDYPEDPPTPGVSIGVDLGGDTFNADEKPLVFPTIRTAKEITMGALGDLDTNDMVFEAEEPVLEMPASVYPTPSPLTASMPEAPTVNSDVEEIAPPTLDYPDLPVLLSLRTDIPVDNINLPAANFTLPTYSNILSTDFTEQFQVGQGVVNSFQSYGDSVVQQYFPGEYALYTQMQARISSVASGAETALSHSVDTQLYEATRSRVSRESDRAEQDLRDAMANTGHEMPGALLAAGKARIRSQKVTTLATTALDVFDKRYTRELEHLRFVLSSAIQLHQSAVALFGAVMGIRLQMFQAAINYGDTAAKFALEVYRLKQRDFEVLSLLVDKQIAIYDALLRAELGKIEVSKALIALESLKAEQNKELISMYTEQLRGQEAKVSLYNGQITALTKMLEMRRLPLDLFQAKIQGYTAMVNAKAGEYDIINRQLAGDETRIRGQMAKTDLYKAKAEVFNTLVGARSKKIEAQTARNQQIIEEFRTRLDAEVKLTDLDVAVSHNAVDVYKSMASVFIAESEERRAAAAFDFQSSLETEKLKLDKVRVMDERRFRSLELELARMKAIVDTNLAGAKALGDMGSAATSAMNVMAEVGASIVA